jgi:triacylglycerol lipase
MNLVFASGFSFPQQLGIIDYFDGVAARFGGQHNVLFPPVQPFGRSEDRAGQLAKAVHEKQFQGPIHIIGHSMAGLDSRYLIAANHHGLSEPGRIATLTTLSTPHKGSPVADLLLGSFLSRLFHRAVTGSIGALGIGTGALADLTVESAAKVPNVALSHAHISYHSYAATGRMTGKPTAVPLGPTHDYIEKKTGQRNDGLVASESAAYGQFQGTIPCDHADLVGHDLDFGLTGFTPIHLAVYEKIISGLAARIPSGP